MNPIPAQYKHTTSQDNSFSIAQYFPFLGWLLNYNSKNLTGDVTAGIIVAIMLVPQSMAYALLAGLPPQVGLYASIIPLIVYGLMGSSRALAVGPVATMSLLVASALSSMELATVQQHIQTALLLALMVGTIQLLMGIFRIGFVVNFLSRPVQSGYTSAVGLIIGLSQFKHLIGVSIPRTQSTPELVQLLVTHLPDSNTTVLLISVISVAILLYFKFYLKKQLVKFNLPDYIIAPLTKLGPLVAVIIGILIVATNRLDTAYAVSIVGEIPAGLPAFGVPMLDNNMISQLLPFALTIAVVGYIEGISIAKALASRRRQKIDANQELIAVGLSNIGASLSGGYPVAGGFSRSVVNFTAGANTGLASILSGSLIAVTILFLTPIFYYLPNAVLGAIIIVAVSALFDIETMKHTWRYDKADFISLIATFAIVLLLGPTNGIFVGVITSIGLYLWRTSRPHVAVVGQIGDTEEYRNILRHDVKTYHNILALRVDESLYFSNTTYLEDIVLGTIADNPEVDHFVLICSAVNFIDSSALDTLESLHYSLKLSNVSMYCSGVKGPVMDKLRSIGFVDRIGKDHFFLSTHEAITQLRMP
jgi:SulP family sulfate permease